jgi:hypothetical protein
MPATTISVIPDTKANLKTQLEARPGLAGVQIVYGIALPNRRNECISICSAKDGQQWGLIGQRARNEEFTLTVYVCVVKTTKNQQAVTERAFAIADEIGDQLRTDPTVDGALMVAQVAGADLDEFANDQKREAILTVRLACQQHRF